MARNDNSFPCPIGCAENVENSMRYLFSSVYDDEVLIFQNLINGEINPKNKCGCTPLHYAAILRRHQIFEFILINCHAKNPANDKGITPLHLAVENDDTTLCRVMLKFLKNGNDKNPRCKDGFTPLFRAAQFGQLEICRLLVKDSTEPNPKSDTRILFL